MIHWTDFDKDDVTTHPGHMALCLVVRKDGKRHFESFMNGAWLHNNNSIVKYVDYSKPREENPIKWRTFTIWNRDTWPTEYGKYLVKLHDDRVIVETFNGTGWAYNHKLISKYSPLT